MKTTATALVFNNENFGNITVYGTPEQPLFVAKEVCHTLGISTYRDTLAKLEDFEKGRRVIIDTPGGKQEMATLTEAGLYSLILRSKKPNAAPFRKWVVTEILPAIRKTGQYTKSESGGEQQSIIALLTAGLQTITSLLQQNQSLMRQALLQRAMVASPEGQVVKAQLDESYSALRRQRNLRIIDEYRELRGRGCNSMRSYTVIGARYGLSVGGVKSIIKRAGIRPSDFGPDAVEEIEEAQLLNND